MTPLLYLRHGPTAWNVLRRLQGRADVPLSDEGRAVVAGWRVPAEVEGWTWVASPLKRARETAALLGHEPKVEARLIELDWGQWEAKTLAELGNPGASGGRGLDFRAPGGESYRDIQERLRPWLAGLERPTVAVGHKGVLMALLALALGWDLLPPSPAKLKPGWAHRFLVEGGQVRAERLDIRL